MFLVKHESGSVAFVAEAQRQDEQPDGPALDDLKFAENMRAIREARGMTQADLVRALKERGWQSVFQTTISRIEKGERPVRYGEALAISRALGTDINRFLLSSADRAIADRLAYSRTRFFDAYQAIQAGVRDHVARHAKLEAAIAAARAAGFEPTELPTDPAEILVPISVSDELALAEEALGLSAEQAVHTGKLFAEMDGGRDGSDS